jgi:hypothetical protein
VRETVGLTERVFGPLVAIGLVLRVILTLTVRLSVVVTHRVIIERVILVVGEPDLLAICVVGFGVRVIVTLRVVDTLPVKEVVKLFTDLVAYGVVATGEGVRVTTERVNVAEEHIDTVVVWLRVAIEGLPLIVGEARPLTDPLTDFVKPVLDPHGLAVLDGTIVAEEETVACELEGDTVAELVLGEGEELLLKAAEAEGFILDIADKLAVPTDDPVIPEVDTLAVLDTRGLVVAPVPEALSLPVADASPDALPAGEAEEVASTELDTTPVADTV